jgi:drug/metabolite transporter (DMT)-like permease
LIVFMLMMGSNALMLAYFLEALEKENSSLMVTAISTSVNFVSTGIIGNFFFVEPVSSTWYGGALLTSCGAALISFSQKSPPVERNKPI